MASIVDKKLPWQFFCGKENCQLATNICSCVTRHSRFVFCVIAVKIKVLASKTKIYLLYHHTRKYHTKFACVDGVFFASDITSTTLIKGFVFYSAQYHLSKRYNRPVEATIICYYHFQICWERYCKYI